MPWPVILTTLTLAMISAWLVFMQDWVPWTAFLVMGLAAAGILIALLAVIMVLSGAENRIEIWHVVRNTFLDDLDQLLKYCRIRRRK